MASKKPNRSQKHGWIVYQIQNPAPLPSLSKGKYQLQSQDMGKLDELVQKCTERGMPAAQAKKQPPQVHAATQANGKG